MSRWPGRWDREHQHIVSIFPKRLIEMMDGMTLVELSLLSGVSLNTLGNWKKGRTLPDLCGLFSVCSVLDASIDWIIGLDAEGAPRRTEYDTQLDD